MKDFIYWLMGDRAGKAIFSGWNWLWGIEAQPDRQPQKTTDPAFATAEESLLVMQRSVDKLVVAVSQQINSYNLAEGKYQQKVKELKALTEAARTAERAGRENEARIALVKVIQLEKVVEQLGVQVKQAEQYVINSQNRLTQEQLKLEQYKAEIQNLKDISEVNLALGEIARVNDELDGSSAKSSLEEVKNAVAERHLQQQLVADLTRRSDEPLGAEVDAQTLTEVDRRLQQIRASTPHQNSDR
jgi:phage shock protein A